MSLSLLSRQDVERWLPEADSSKRGGGFITKLFVAIHRSMISLPKGALSTKSGTTHNSRNEIERFFLWGQGLSVLDGDLDDTLAHAKELHDEVLTLLLRLGTSVLHCLSRDWGESLDAVSEQFDDLKRLLDTTESLLHDDDDDSNETRDEDSFSVSDTSDFGVAEILDEIAVYIDCLLDLSSVLERPALDVHLGPAEAEAPSQPQEHFQVSSEEALIYCRRLRDRFEQLPKCLVELLAETNVLRAARLRETRAQRAEKQGLGDADDITESLFSNTDPRMVTETTKSSALQSSVFSRGLRKPKPAVNFPDDASEATFATFSTAASAIAQGRPRVPPIPDAKEGLIECPLCLDFLLPSDGGSAATALNWWKVHVFGDLMPYVCTVEGCPISNRGPFSKSGIWAKHEASHWTAQTPSESPCAFCGAQYRTGSAAYCKHVARHLREVSLYVVPQTMDDDAEDDESGLESDGLLEDARELESKVAFDPTADATIPQRPPEDEAQQQPPMGQSQNSQNGAPMQNAPGGVGSGAAGVNPNAAPGPIPATTPLVVRQDQNGVQWIAFEYSRDRVKMEYTIRCDVESVNTGELTPEFKTDNCVYPRACVPKDQYRGNRLQYETECNTVGWALAELNPPLRGKRGLIQRAVDSWRNSKPGPEATEPIPTSAAAEEEASAPTTHTNLEADLDDIIFRLLAGSRPGTKVHLPDWEIYWLLKTSQDIFLSQPILLELEAPLKICGSIHGQYHNLVTLLGHSGFFLEGSLSEANYIFLGNYVDYGKQSIETMCLMLAYKVKYPENFFVLRGNHECARISRLFGFYDECKRRYDIRMWKSFTDNFNCMPVAARIDEKILCVNGGLSPDLDSFEQIRRILRPTEIPEKGLLHDLMWANPDEAITGWSEADDDGEVSATFGPDVVSRFLQKHDMDLIVRSKQVVEKGYEFFSKRQLTTIFGAARFRAKYDNDAASFRGKYDNAAAIMNVDESLLITFQVLKPTKKFRRRHDSDSSTESSAVEFLDEVSMGAPHGMEIPASTAQGSGD